MATVYLHIGAPKTATSTLQTVFSTNYKKLLKQGVLYPRTARHGDAHHLLVCDLIEKYQNHRMADIWYGDCERGEAWAQLAADLKDRCDSIHSVVLSSELFFGQTKKVDEMHQDVLAHLKGHEIKIVVYLRRQDQMYSSFFNQDVKGVRQWAYSAYQFYDTHQVFEHNYFRLMNIWSKAFGRENILIRPYESEQWPNGDIVQDFCALLNIAPLKSGKIASNPGLGSNQLYIKRCLNRVGFNKNDNDEVVSKLINLCPEEPIADCQYVRKRRYRQLRKEWMRVNHKLEADFLGGKELFSTAIPGPERMCEYEVDQKAITDNVKAISLKVIDGSLGKHTQLFAKALLLIAAERDLWSTLDEDTKLALLGCV